MVLEDSLENWKEVSIGEICSSIKSGGTPLSKVTEYYENGQIPWLKTKEIKNSRIYGAENYITELGLLNSSASIIPANSISVAMYGDGGTAGRVGLTKIPLTTNQACCNLTVDESKGDYEFIFYNLLGSYDDLVAMKTGSGQQNLSSTLIKNFKLNLPPLPEQRAIAAVLSSLYNKIDLLHRQNATLEALAETLFRQWFVEEAKEEWEEVTITKLFEIRDGTHDSPKQKAFGKRLVTSKHISGNKLDFESAYFISEEDFTNVNKRSRVDSGDILFSMIGTIGLTYLEQSETVDYAIKNIGLLKTSQNPAWCYYTYLWIKSSLGQDFIHEHRSGSTQEYISLGSLRGIIFKKPPTSLLTRFNDAMKPLFDKRKTNSAAIQTLSTLRDTLLPKLMSGEVRVNTTDGKA